MAGAYIKPAFRQISLSAENPTADGCAVAVADWAWMSCPIELENMPGWTVFTDRCDISDEDYYPCYMSAAPDSSTYGTS